MITTALSSLTKQEAQALYDELGTTEIAKRFGVNRSTAHIRLAAIGIKFRKRGDNVRKRSKRLAIQRVHCHEEQRLCVLHDIDGACDECRIKRENRHQSVRAGIAEMEIWA